MSRPPAPLPMTLADAFSCAEARAAGVSRGRLAAKDLHAPFHGVRIRAVQPAIEDDGQPYLRDRQQRARVRSLAQAYATRMSPNTFFAGRTAAVLIGLPLAHGQELDVGVRAPHRAPRGRGIRGRKLAPRLITLVRLGDLVLTDPATTWASLGEECSLRDLIVLGDAIVRVPRDDRGTPQPFRRLGTKEDLQGALEAGSRRGITKLRAALELIRVGSASPVETDYRLAARRSGLPEPELDVEIRDAGGRLLGVSEVVYRPYRVVVEVEGDHHRTSRRQWTRDIRKYADYAAAGWEVVRVTSEHLHTGEAMRMVRDVLTRAS